MKANAKYNLKAARPILSILLLLISAAYVLYSPKLYEGGLNGDPYRAWLMHSKEPTVGVIKVWHIVDFKPYVGSLGSWIEKRAKAYSSRFIGILSLIHI